MRTYHNREDGWAHKNIDYRGTRVGTTGENLLHMITFKRKTKLQVSFPKGVFVSVSKNGWMHECTILLWLEEVFCHYCNGFFNPKSLLILDSTHAHLLVSVNKHLGAM